MNNNCIFFLLFFVFSTTIRSQVKDSIVVETDFVQEDSVSKILPENDIQNAKAIILFLEKLELLKQQKIGKINIVHIGDSHIQADLMTNKIRKNLQNVFGNAGRGFVFPHNLARTNGSWDIRFLSDDNWNNYRIVAPIGNSKVGLSGIALASNSYNFSLEITIKDQDNIFNCIKIITPKNEDNFGFSLEKKIISINKEIPRNRTHKIRNGEAISTIAAKYNISITALKSYNRLKSDAIRAGKSLHIPTSEMQINVSEKAEFVPLIFKSEANCHLFESEKALNKIYIISNSNQSKFNLNGIILENKNTGILYHNIGVNGAKFSDFNKYQLFFEQLKALQPDLIVLSLGTNESFDKMNAEEYLVQMDLFIQNAKSQNPKAEFLIITPPPTQFKRKFPNVFVADYAQKIINFAAEKNLSVWNLYSQLGGMYGVRTNYNKGIIGNDRIHYTKKGYEIQGDLFSEALLKTFENFKNISKN